MCIAVKSVCESPIAILNDTSQWLCETDLADLIARILDCTHDFRNPFIVVVIIISTVVVIIMFTVVFDSAWGNNKNTRMITHRTTANTVVAVNVVCWVWDDVPSRVLRPNIVLGVTSDELRKCLRPLLVPFCGLTSRDAEFEILDGRPSIRGKRDGGLR